MGTKSQIAVIGMACRLPGGADNPESLWSMLAEGRDGLREVPKDRWDWKSFYHEDPDAKEATNFSRGYYVNQDLSAFDARFFGIPGAEAEGIDPQQRLLLEVTYEAVENAGIPIEDLRGSNTSVHMAMFARDYDRMGYRDGPQLHKTHIIGSGDAILANRISYVFDLKGSSNTLDTGCSGSLVALHQACLTLRADESALALAGASQLLLTPDQSIAMSQLTNKDGKCYTFDDRGAGYGRGEGLGVLVLKRLDRALADGDAIHAVFVDSGVGHDGKTSGIFLPNADAQEALARSVYAKAGLDPRETLYIESHGTGTVAGDNAEIQSIARVFGREAGRKSELPVGSIKTNIGHLESASGVAGAIKAVLVLKKNQIPPHLNFINPKPNLRLDERGIKVPLELTSLTPEGHVGPRRVSVTSFGYGGTNAHAILEAYNHAPMTNSRSSNGLSNGHSNGYSNGLSNGLSNGYSNGLTNGYSNGIANENGKDDDPGKLLVVLSANSETSLGNMISKLQQWLGSDQGRCTSFTDLAYTLNVRRSKLPWRCSVVASNLLELEEVLGDSNLRPVKAVKGVGTAFIFTGQGAQWFAMGRELLKSSQVFASSMALCNQVMKGLGCDWDLIEELLRDKETTRIGDSRFSQPCTTAVQIALVDLLENYGIRPEAVCGHSSGEIAAAYAAGALSQGAAMQASYNRGIWSSVAKGLNATPGSMLAVGEGEEAIKERIKGIASGKGKVTIACVNSPESTTISGDLPAIKALQAILDTASVFNRRLQVDSAYHSSHMDVVAKSYLSSLDNMAHAHGIAKKDIAFYSSVTGTRKLSDFGPSYWVSNLVSQVKFSAASRLVAEHLSAAGSTASNLLVEVGPHSALAGPLRQSLSNFKGSGAPFKYTYIPCLLRNESAVSTIQALVGKVFEAGRPVQLDIVMRENASLSSQYQVIDSLPTYAWDHSTYWHESRLSKGHRLRPFPNHDLLGLFDVHSSPNEPRWRYHVSLQALPWLRDHVVEGLVIFPGAGYLTMVTEAMKQLFQLRKTPGYVKCINFRNVTFAKAVVVPSDGAGAKGDREVELQLTISPARQHVGSPWEYFRVLSYDSQNDSWTEHCTGLTASESITSKAQSQPEVVEGTRVDEGLGHLTVAGAAEMLADIQANSTIQVDPAKVYSDLTVSGNTYGPSFQGLKEIHVGKCCGLARIIVDDFAQMMPGHYMQPHTIHPTTLDGMIQLEAVVFRRECTIAPLMPVLLGDISISADIDVTPGAEMLVALYLFPESRRSATGNFCAYQKQSNGTFQPVLTGSAIRPQVIGEISSTNSLQQKMSYRLECKPDVDHITQRDFMDHVSRHNLFDVGYGRLSKLVAENQLRLNDQAATIFIRRVVNRVREEHLSTACTPHLSKLLTWMVEWNQSEAKQFLAGITPEDEARLIEQARDDNIVGFTLNHFGPRLFDIFTGKADSLELLIQDDSLGRLYSEYTLFNCHYAQVAEYMQTLVHKNPKMKVLEIGAGTGSATMPLMESIERNGRLLLDGYTYTDISSGFFERARNTFSKWTSQISFKTLDISRDPVAQGYTAHTFDLIVASIVLHATPLMDVTMTSVRRLLKPGGRLILIELTQVAAAQNLIFGTLEGWWMSEDGRKDGPLLSLPEWDSVLKHHGFSGTDLAIPAHTGNSSAISSMIVAQATGTLGMSDGQDIGGPGPMMEMKASVHLGHSHSSQAALGDAIRLSLGNKGVACSQHVWGTSNTVTDADRLLIIVDSAEHPLLLDPTQEAFKQTKQLLLQGRNVLWVSVHYSPPSAETAALKNMVNGMGRVVRRENPGLRFITVDVQDQIQLSGSGNRSLELERSVQILADIVMSSFWPVSENVRAEELQYIIGDGKLTIPRVIPDDRFARYIESQDQDQGATSLVECRYLDKDRPLMFDVQVPGLLNTIRFVDNMMLEPLGPDQIEVQAFAHGVNFKDVFIALGQMQPGTEMSGEAAGVVTKIGSNVQSWKTGDRVLGLMVAPFGNLIRISGTGVVAIPDSITFADAASLAIVYYTSWYCLTHAARLEKGQSVLIHAASGGVGQAAIQIAKFIGAEIFATAGSVSKRKLIQDQYGIPESHIFPSNSRHFKKGIMRLTQGKGVDVVLNSLSGELLMDSWDCVAQFGTFVEIGKTDIYGRSQLNMANFEKQATFAAVDVSHMYRLRPEYVTRGLREVFSMVDKGLLKTVYPVTAYPISAIEETFRLIAARKHVGKLVLVADKRTVVQATRPRAPPLRLRGEGTYVIGGGLGDLGKRIGRFLVEHGASHIVALSRRDVDSQQRASLEESFSKLGGTLHIVKCDIANEESTNTAAKKIAELPPVRGVIQSALVLCDHPMEYMGLEDWNTAVNPKVWGTRNMHKAFCSPETTDFFIMLSSVASLIGSPSQSNYAAGNAFQDAFARAQGTQAVTKYTSINVGAVEGSEQIARALDQNSEITRIIGAVSFNELLATLTYAMGPQARLDEAIQCIMPFDRDTMEDAIGQTALSDHLFDHVPSKRGQEEATSNSAADSKKPSATKAIERAESVEEAENIVQEALLDKFAAFIGDDVLADQPIAALGLDSLVSIELKNWIKHIFQTPLQTSELIGAQSIIALAQLIVLRMDLKCKVQIKADDNDEKQEGARKSQTESSPKTTSTVITNGHDHDGNPKPKSHHGWNCCRLNKKLPDQPLPDLDDALDFWLEANRHLYSTQQLEFIQPDIQAMRAPGSPARQVLQDLFRTHGHEENNGWYNDILTDARWLSRRSPIAPYASIMGAHRSSKRPHSQAERAAIISSSALSFKRAMKAGIVEPLRLAGKPECTWRWDWLFNSVRVPHVGCDKMMRYDLDDQGACDHIAVLRRGHIFKVMLQDENNGKDVPFEELKATFEAIVAQVEDDGVWPGILTTDERDSWAQTREKLLALSLANAKYFHVIDTAMFVLCLDDGHPATSEERVRQGYIGDGSNRWFDKVLQFYVSANGCSGSITEHGIIDGTTPARLSEWMVTAMDEYSPSSNVDHNHLNGSLSSRIKLEEVVLQTTPEIESHMSVLRNRFLEYTSPATRTYVREHLTEFGTDFLMQGKVSVKGVVDITFQLALRLFFGGNVPSWEPTSTAHFHTGRSDAVQKATPAVNAFCDAAAEAYKDQDQSQHGKPARLAALLSSATKQMSADMQTMLNGRSYMRVFEVLSLLWPFNASIPKPRFLSEHVFFGEPFPSIFAQTNALDTDMVVEDFATLLPDAEGFWTIILPEKSEIRVYLTGGSPERTAAFIKQLHRAARIVRDVVQTA